MRVLLFFHQAALAHGEHTTGHDSADCGHDGVAVSGREEDEHINLAIHHDAFISSDIYDLADHATAIFIGLIFDELAFQTQREFIDDRSVNGFSLAGCQAAGSELVRCIVPGYDTEIVSFNYMSRISDAHGESASGFDVLHCLMRLGKIQCKLF